jgi:two-component system, OmpR family, sensor histidine kinase SaeS
VIQFALVAGGCTLVAGLLVALGLRRLPSLRLQLVALTLLALLLPLAAVLVSGVVMFTSGHDLTVLAVAAGAATASLAAALLLAGSIHGAIERVRAASAALAHGDLGARAPETGPTELAELAMSLNEMATHLEELFDARRQLVAWASHDLRTPLANMQAMLEALEDGVGDPERYLPALREQTRTLSQLVDDLFELARIDAGALTLELRDAPVGALVRSCLRGLEAEARARGVTMTAHTNGDEASARCAPDKVERVLLNLLTNALRHTPSDGTVAVVVEPSDREVLLSVEDTGEGLPAESSQRVFERFWRADPARSKGSGGSGLGLAIARGLVEAQGGRIWAENRQEGGARISFTLPRAS